MIIIEIIIIITCNNNYDDNNSNIALPTEAMSRSAHAKGKRRFHAKFAHACFIVIPYQICNRYDSGMQIINICLTFNCCCKNICTYLLDAEILYVYVYVYKCIYIYIYDININMRI